MKKTTVIIIMLMSAALINAAELTVVDYYNLLPKELVKSGKYEIKNKGGKWITQSSADYEMDVIADIKNNYLELNDQGTGGGSIIHEFAVFLRSGQSPVLGLSEKKI